MKTLEELLAKAKKLDNDKRYEEIIKMLPDSLLKTYRNSDLYAEKAQAHWRLKQYELCDKVVNIALKFDANNAKANNYKGNLHVKNKAYNEARIAFEAAIKANPKYAFPYNGLGNVYRTLKEYDKAIEYYDKAIEIEPKFANPYIGLGNVYRILKLYDRALEAYHKAIEIDPKLAISHAGLGNVYRILKQYDKALDAYEKAIEIDPNFANSYLGQGNTYGELERYEHAIKAYEKAIEINPHYASPYYGLGLVFNNQKQYDKALTAYEKAIELNPNLAGAYYGLGHVFNSQKQYNKAVVAFKKAIELNLNHASSYYGLGLVLNNLKQYHEAVTAFEKAIEIEPEFAPSYIDLGNAYYYQLEYGKAIEKYEKSIQIDSTLAGAFYNLGLAHENLKEYKNALNNFRKSIEINDDDFYIKSAKGRIEEIEKLLSNTDYGRIADLIKQISAILCYKGNCITHYTSLYVASALMLENSPFRISEGSFLNDTSEGRELFKFLEFNYTILATDDTIAKPFVQRPFIGSFVPDDKKDLLSMWRMYGKQDKDEAKGCAITIKRETFLNAIKENATDSTSSTTVDTLSEEFSFFYVAYRSDDKTFIVPALDKAKEQMLNDLVSELKEKLVAYNDSDKNLKEKQDVQEALNSIAYLFKTAEYQYEQELRLVVKGTGFKKKVDKVLGRVYIELVKINPIIAGITLGPKVEKAEEVAAMFHYALDEELHYSSDNRPPEILISRLPFK
ncbi:MAG: tetratricopeptide repeat protein [Flavipsychrobacter sp.]|nr:tetratricopeptide repeat protein [Flavipsychrobacter sp.]